MFIYLIVVIFVYVLSVAIIVVFLFCLGDTSIFLMSQLDGDVVFFFFSSGIFIQVVIIGE